MAISQCNRRGRRRWELVLQKDGASEDKEAVFTLQLASNAEVMKAEALEAQRLYQAECDEAAIARRAERMMLLEEDFEYIDEITAEVRV